MAAGGGRARVRALLGARRQADIGVLGRFAPDGAGCVGAADRPGGRHAQDARRGRERDDAEVVGDRDEGDREMRLRPRLNAGNELT